MTTAPATITIVRARGDTFPFTFTVQDSDGVAVNITGYSFTLTVDPGQNPTDATDNVFALTGSVTDAAAGVVQFEPNATQADNLGGFYADLEQTDGAGKLRTIGKGTWTFVQDISK